MAGRTAGRSEAARLVCGPVGASACNILFAFDFKLAAKLELQPPQILPRPNTCSGPYL